MIHAVRMEDTVLGTPSLDNTSYETLLRIVSNVGAEGVNGTTKMPIAATDNLWCTHTLVKTIEDLCKRCLKELPTEFEKMAIPLVFLLRYVLLVEFNNIGD
jgi:hypothetical protein